MHPVQAVMVGPLVMAGLTDGPRQIEADPSAVAELLSDVPSSSLVELRPNGKASGRLRYTGSDVEVAGNGTVPSLYDSWQLRRVPDA